MKKLKGIDYQIIYELLRNSRISDKKLGSSQPRALKNIGRYLKQQNTK